MRRLALATRWPNARVVAPTPRPACCARLAQLDAADARIEWLCAEAEALPLPEASVDLVFSNLMLPWCEDLDAVFAEVARVLRPRGLFTFTTFGPDTLVELRAAWREADDACTSTRSPTCMTSATASCVPDFPSPCSTYPLHADLSGRRRPDAGPESDRRAERGLRPSARTDRPRPDERCRNRLRAYRRDGVLPATHEVVFGQAWGAVERRDGENDGEFAFPVGDIGRRGRPAG